MSSTEAGKHGSFDFIAGELCDTLFKANVFEVAFGGGEPTHYVDGDNTIIDILHAYKQKRFKTGVTTKNYHLRKKPKEWLDAFVSMCDSVAFSVNSVEDLEATLPNLEIMSNGENITSVYIQMILGLVPFEETVKIIEKASKEYAIKGLTLLGYKDFGFGKRSKPFDVPEDWVKTIRSKWHRSLGVDSVIATNRKEELLRAGVNEVLLVSGEGDSTCFVDAVDRIIKPSSFTENGVPWGDKPFLEAFSYF